MAQTNHSLAEDFFYHLILTIGFRKWIAEPGEYSVATYRMLSTLKKEQPCSLKQLCGFLGVTTSTGSIMSDKLVKQGLVDRCQNAVDRRKIVLSLTPQGQKLVDHDLEQQMKQLGAAFEQLTQQDMETLHQSIRMADAILDKIMLFHVHA